MHDFCRSPSTFKVLSTGPQSAYKLDDVGRYFCWNIHHPIVGGLPLFTWKGGHLSLSFHPDSLLPCCSHVHPDTCSKFCQNGRDVRLFIGKKYENHFVLLNFAHCFPLFLPMMNFPTPKVWMRRQVMCWCRWVRSISAQPRPAAWCLYVPMYFVYIDVERWYVCVLYIDRWIDRWMDW